MSKLLEKLKKNSTVKAAEILDESELFTDVDETATDIIGLNIALSGSIDGGLKSGILTIAGPSRHFKTMYALLMAAAYLKKHKDAVVLFYDSEFGSPMEYFASAGIDPKRVIHTPILNIEELKFDLMQQLDGLERGDKCFVLIDSVGSLASKKEADDALDGKSVADMSRAKSLKSFYRIITPYLRIKNIPLVQIAHIYMTQEMFSKPIVGGGTGVMLSSDNVWIVGRSQEKDGTELAGYNFTIRIEKSRYTREKSSIPLLVTFERGISRYSGLLDIALASGAVIKPSNGWYSRVNDDGEIEAKKWRIKDTDCSAFFEPILKTKLFLDYVDATYKVSHGDIVSDATIDNEMEAVTYDE